METAIKAKKDKGLVAATTNPQHYKLEGDVTAKNHFHQQLTSTNCDRYKTCSANICPLDQDWQKRKHLCNDRVCFYLIEAQKIDAKALFEHGGRGNIYSAMEGSTSAIINRHSSIKSTLERARLTGSRMARKIGGKSYGADYKKT